MRILFVCFPYSVHAARWVGLLANQGWDLHVFPSQPFDSLHEKFEGITYWPAQPRDFGLRPGIRVDEASRALQSRIRGDLSHIRYLRRVIEEGGFDIVHSMEFQHAGYLTLRAFDGLARRRSTWIATNYGSDLYLYRSQPEHAVHIGGLLKSCDVYAAECSRDVGIAREMGFAGPVFEVCPNSGGIDLEQISALRSDIEPSRRRVIAIKGYEHFAGRALTVVDVIGTLVAELQAYRIVIYAPSDAVRQAAEALRGRTGLAIECYAELEPQEKILALHGQSRISIANSISDGISTSLLEAMAMGSFPIQSATSCADEWISHGVSGFLTDPNNPSSIKAALQTALADEQLVDRAALVNDRVIRERADHRVVRERIVQAYHRAVAARCTLSAGASAAQPVASPRSAVARSDAARPVLTVITPTYNRASFLPETISSVLSQSFRDFEYLIFDDGSTDDTEAVVTRFDDERIRYFRHQNLGETRTVNRALAMVAGDYFTIVNSDDPAVAGAFEAILGVLSREPDALIAYPDWLVIDENSRHLDDVRLRDFDWEALLMCGTVGIGPGAVFRRSAIELVGFRNPLIRYAADLDYIFRLALCGRMVHVPELLGTHRVHAGSASISQQGERLSLETLELLRVYGGHPLQARGLRQRQRESFAVGCFSASTVAPEAQLAVRLLTRGFLAHPIATLRRIEEHSIAETIRRLREIGCERNGRAGPWLVKALAAPSRQTSLHATLRALLGDPVGSLEFAMATGVRELAETIRATAKTSNAMKRVAAGQNDSAEKALTPALGDGSPDDRRSFGSILRRTAATIPGARRLRTRLLHHHREHAELMTAIASIVEEHHRLSCELEQAIAGTKET